jgi:hypothetical protein
MKSFISLLFVVTLAWACNKKNNTIENVKAEPAAETTDTTAVSAPISESAKSELYACPMHPEVTGKKGDKCPRCQMELTEPVK